MKKLKEKLRYLIGGAIAVLLLTGVSLADSSPTIVSVDLNRLMENYPAFQLAQAEYQSKVQGMQEELAGMDEEEQAMVQQSMQMQLQKLGSRLQGEAETSLKSDIAEIAEEMGFDYIVDSGSLISGGRDVTAKILEELK